MVGRKNRITHIIYRVDRMLGRLIVDGLLVEIGRYFVNNHPKKSIYFIVAIIAILLIMSSS